MATYYNGAPEIIQPESLQTLYLMNPSFIDYTESSNPMSHHPQAQSLVQHHFVGIPLHSSSHDLPHHPHPIHDSSSSVQVLSPGLGYNLWTQRTDNHSTSTDVSQHQLSSSTLASAQQALSLTLSPHEMAGRSQVSGLQSFLMGSKYLKAAQELLDEVVNVGKAIKSEAVRDSQTKMKSSSKDSAGTKTAATEEESSGKRIAADLTTVERQELQMKKAKLVSMLDEVEQRYRQYRHQMQIVVTSFEAIAGPGSARTYTALALQTISKQFRCLREAITGQIQETGRSLGEEDVKCPGSRLRFVDNHLRQQRALQQLGIVQHNAWRPQRGLPERSVSVLRAWLFEHFLHPYPKDSDKIMLAKQTGLTRSQVSNWFINARVRLWKPMVEEMYLEEIKEQEVHNNGDAENSSKSDVVGSPATRSYGQQESDDPVAESLKTDQAHVSTSVQASSMSNAENQTSYYDNETIVLPSCKKARSDETEQAKAWQNSIALHMKPDQPSNQELLLQFMDGGQRVGSQGYSLMQSSVNHEGHYGAYTFGELGRFEAEQFTPSYTTNGVSLTLGLPHCDNISISEAQQPFMSTESLQPLGSRLGSGFGTLNNNVTVAHSSTIYDNDDIQNRKSFAAQLLPDYVA